MDKFHDIASLDELIQKDQKIQVYGCPYFLEINDKLSELIKEYFVWDSPKNILIFTESIEFTSQIMSSVQMALKEISVPYEYDKTNYTLKDYNSELRIKNINKKDDINIKTDFYDFIIIHFCEDKTENVFEKIALIGKKILFFTLDDEKSIFYSLPDDDIFYRLYSEQSNQKIDEYLKSEVVDEKARQLIEGKFKRNKL